MFQRAPGALHARFPVHLWRRETGAILGGSAATAVFKLGRATFASVRRRPGEFGSELTMSACSRLGSLQAGREGVTEGVRTWRAGSLTTGSYRTSLPSVHCV
jgi:hypothetical protein